MAHQNNRSRFSLNDPAKGLDRMCDATYIHTEGNVTVDACALANAPVAGRWFSGAFQVLLQNAYAPLQ